MNQAINNEPMRIDLHLSNDLQVIGTHIPGDIMTQIQHDLTLPNPKYVQAEKYGKRNMKYSRIHPTIHYATYTDTRMCIPRGYLSTLERLLRECGIPYCIHSNTHPKEPIELDFTGCLHPHQTEAVAKILPNRYGVLEAPTGSGKTVIALSVIAHRKQPALIIVHTKELLYQWRDRILQFTDIKPEEIGLIGDGHKTIGSKITIAIINTLTRCLECIKDRIGFVLVDECHHVPARTFTDVISRLDTPYMLGLSATPYRNDGLTRVIYLFMGDRVHSIPHGYLVNTGKIMRASLVPRYTQFDYPNAQENYAGCISALTNDWVRNALILDDVIARIQASKGIALVISDRKEHAKALHGYLTNAGIDAKLLTGDTPKKQREEVREDLREGNGRVLISIPSLIGEGFDLSNLSSIFLATPIKFEGKTIQCIGRILRTSQGKEDPLIYDYIDRNHVLISSHKKRLDAYKKLGVTIPEWHYQGLNNQKRLANNHTCFSGMTSPFRN